MKVQVYAALKDYFEQEFEIAEPVHSIEELRLLLLQRNPAAEAIMPVCRFAVNDEFVDHRFQLHANDILHIIPPSSGG
ncbi:MAG TPA: MoaD/ThiS family protein [Chitinophagaceae bacterium]|jgi:molybdopterin synthase sulfur carrier subunit